MPPSLHPVIRTDLAAIEGIEVSIEKTCRIPESKLRYKSRGGRNMKLENDVKDANESLTEMRDQWGGMMALYFQEIT